MVTNENDYGYEMVYSPEIPQMIPRKKPKKTSV